MNPIILCACLALIGQSVLGLDWAEYKSQYNKQFKHQLEETVRRNLFEANKERIEKFNREKAEQVGYELGVNHLTDRTEEELSIMRGFKWPKEMEELKSSSKGQKYLEDLLASVDDKDLPKSVDWRTVKGRVSDVKNQGPCGSCWAFSATGALEGQMTVRNSSLIPLSEQDLVDCSVQDLGCEGGIMAYAWEDIGRKGGVESEKDYPYEAKARKCRFVKSKSVFTDKGYAILKKGDEAGLKKLVATFGPVSVAIDATGSNFRDYKSGVYYGDDCDSDNLDHGVLVVGYGTDEATKKDYWIVKNSWAASWGDQGYIKMARNDDNYCGIATAAMIPTF